MKSLNIVMLGTAILLMTFQNCGQISVSEAPQQVARVEVLKDKPSFAICPVEGAPISVPVTYVFIVDMSLSNLGGFVQESCGGSSYRYHLTLNQATDHEVVGTSSKANRLEGISNFVSQIADSNPNLRFSVIGFSTQKILGGAGVTCANSATATKSTFLSRLAELKNIQTADYRKSGTVCAFNSPFTMGTTSYVSAIDCLSENVEAEALLSGATRPFYQIFFITDGKPNEKNSSGQVNLEGICGPSSSPAGQSCRNAIQACGENEDCIYDYITNNTYVPKLQLLINSLKASGYGFNLKPIFYEKAGTPAGQSDFPRASLSLNKLAQADGSQTTTTSLTDLSSLAAELREALGPQATVNYTFTSPMVVNVNALPRGDSALLDSDGDGLTDSLEDSLAAKGYNKNNPRSTGILDSICHVYLGDMNCSIAASPSCADVKVGFKLNKCDKDKLLTVLPGKELTGYDSDNDGVVDFIEFIRGTNPFLTDYGLDDDDDGVGNITELYRGTDPMSAKGMYQEYVTVLDVKEVVAAQSSQCLFSGLSLELKIDNISLLPQKESNEVYVTFFAEPSGTLNGKKKLYSARLIINSQGKFNKVSLDNDDIELVGEF